MGLSHRGPIGRVRAEIEEGGERKEGGRALGEPAGQQPARDYDPGVTPSGKRAVGTYNRPQTGRISPSSTIRMRSCCVTARVCGQHVFALPARSSSPSVFPSLRLSSRPLPRSHDPSTLPPMHLPLSAIFATLPATGASLRPRFSTSVRCHTFPRPSPSPNLSTLVDPRITLLHLLISQNLTSPLIRCLARALMQFCRYSSPRHTLLILTPRPHATPCPYPHLHYRLTAAPQPVHCPASCPPHCCFMLSPELSLFSSIFAILRTIRPSRELLHSPSAVLPCRAASLRCLRAQTDVVTLA